MVSSTRGRGGGLDFTDDGANYQPTYLVTDQP
jgi:hypothetical protein